MISAAAGLLEVSIAWPKVVQIPPEMRGLLGFIEHDFQSSETSFLPRVYGEKYGLPETEKLGDNMAEDMVEAWQWFWFDLLSLFSPPEKTEAQIKQSWADLTHGAKFKTNKHGWNNGYTDYINRVNIELDKPMRWENVTTCGNPVLLTGEKRNFGGNEFQGVWCLDTTFDPPADFIGHPAFDCLVHSATTCRPERGTQPNFPLHSIAPNGTFLCNNFPHTEGRRVPVPFQSARGRQADFMGIAVRENWIASWRLCKLEDHEYPVIATVR